MTQDQVDKTLEQLEKEKIQAEINILEARLIKEFPEDKPAGRMDRLAEFASKWSTFILRSITLVSAIFGIFVPLSDYLAQQQKALEYELNENMIGFINDLNTDSLANRGVVMLSYYEVNSIPILLFYLETSGNEAIEFRAKLIETIGLIYADSRNREILDLIAGRLQNTFNHIKDDYTSKTEINPNRRLAMLNYLELVDEMKLVDRDHVKIKNLYTQLHEDICQTEGFSDNIFAIYSTICFYLDVDLDCKSLETN